MKKFLALLLLGTCMSAMAVNVDEAVESPAQAVTFQTPLDYMQAHNLSLENNIYSVNHPLGLTQDDLLALSGKYITYMRYAHYLTNGGIVEVDPYYSGNTTSKVRVNNGNLQISGLFKNTYNNSTFYLTVAVDYEAGTVQLGHNIVLKSINPSSTEPTRVDTVMRAYLQSEGYYRNKDTSAKINGKLLNDGSIMFSDAEGEGYVYYWYQIITRYEDGEQVSSDTTSYYNVYRGTQLLVSNGLHEYQGKDGLDNSVPVYLYQAEGDSTLMVWNLWGLRYPYNYMNISEDGSVAFPRQKIRYKDWSDYNTDTKTYTNWWYNVGCEWDFDNATFVSRHAGATGTVTPDSLTFEPVAIFNYYTSNSKTYYGYYVGPYFNNKLTFTNGAQFVIPTPVVPEVVRGDVNGDDNVDPSDIAALINYLLNGAECSLANADCNQDGSVDPADIATLINFLLGGNVW